MDGKFKKELRDEELYFRGSRNQRLIDVQTSLQKGATVIYHYNPKRAFKKEEKFSKIYEHFYNVIISDANYTE